MASSRLDGPTHPLELSHSEHRSSFQRFAHRACIAAGSPWAFGGALTAIAIWAACGPLLNYSDSWQLIINTSTTIITFLMVFLIQKTQNRDAKAIHLKLDELLHALKRARTSLVKLEDLSDEEIEELEREFERMRDRAKARSMQRDGKS